LTSIPLSPRSLVVPTVTAAMLLAAGCGSALDEEAIHDDWCDRVEAWRVAYSEIPVGIINDPQVLHEHMELVDELHAATLDDPIPQPLHGAIQVILGEVDALDDRMKHEERFADAFTALGDYAEDACGIVFDPPAIPDTAEA
jgi:hypothetical protein